MKRRRKIRIDKICIFIVILVIISGGIYYGYNKLFVMDNSNNDNGSDITQSFIDREIEDLIYEIAETRSKANEYDEIGDTYRELVISEKEYNKYNYTYDNIVTNELDSVYHKIVVYKDILTKTITVTNSNGQQEEINVLIVE